MRCKHKPSPGQLHSAEGLAGREGHSSSLLRFDSPQEGVEAGPFQEGEEAGLAQEGVEAGLSQAAAVGSTVVAAAAAAAKSCRQQGTGL